MYRIAEKRVHHPAVYVIRLNFGNITNYALFQTLQVGNNNFKKVGVKIDLVCFDKLLQSGKIRDVSAFNTFFEKCNYFTQGFNFI